MRRGSAGPGSALPKTHSLLEGSSVRQIRTGQAEVRKM